MSRDRQHAITVLPERRNGVCERRSLRADRRPGVSPRFWRGMLVVITLWLFALISAGVCARQARAEEAEAYTPEDTLAAIDEASMETGVSEAWLYATVRCETGGTFNPYAVGRQGELGPAQLHPRGELRRFYSLGYTDPFSPWQSIRFMADRFSVGGARAWSCA